MIRLLVLDICFQGAEERWSAVGKSSWGLKSLASSMSSSVSPWTMVLVTIFPFSMVWQISPWGCQCCDDNHSRQRFVFQRTRSAIVRGTFLPPWSNSCGAVRPCPWMSHGIWSQHDLLVWWGVEMVNRFKHLCECKRPAVLVHRHLTTQTFYRSVQFVLCREEDGDSMTRSASTHERSHRSKKISANRASTWLVRVLYW